MIIKLQIPWRRIFKDLKLPMILITIYMGIISVLDYFLSPTEIFHVPIVLISVPGTVIALLLAFRTNSAYDRWWEARIIWGSIVNDSRTWVRQLMTFIDTTPGREEQDNVIRRLSYRQIAWTFALARQLRKQNPLPKIQGFVADSELEKLKQRANVPNSLLFNQGQEIKKLHASGQIDQYQLVQLDSTLTRLTDAMGKCERIKNTVFPSSYSLLVDMLIYLWIIFLPFGLIDSIGFCTHSNNSYLGFRLFDHRSDSRLYARSIRKCGN